MGQIPRSTERISTFGIVSLTFNPDAKFEVCIFSHSRDIRGSQNWKVGQVT